MTPEQNKVCEALEQIIRVVEELLPGTPDSTINPLYLARRQKAAVLALQVGQNELLSWFDLLNRADESLTARQYVERHGAAVEDWLGAFLESSFGRVVEGEPTAVSQFGVVYETMAIRLDTRDGHENMMAMLRSVVEAELPVGHRGMTLVWRIKPQIAAMSPDFENNITHTHDVRIRYRSHTLPGIDVEPASEAGTRTA